MLEKNDAPPAEKGRRADGDFLAVFLSSNNFAAAGASESWRRASTTSTVTACAGAAGNQLTEVERA